MIRKCVCWLLVNYLKHAIRQKAGVLLYVFVAAYECLCETNCDGVMICFFSNWVVKFSYMHYVHISILMMLYIHCTLNLANQLSIFLQWMKQLVTKKGVHQWNTLHMHFTLILNEIPGRCTSM